MKILKPLPAVSSPYRSIRNLLVVCDVDASQLFVGEPKHGTIHIEIRNRYLAVFGRCWDPGCEILPTLPLPNTLLRKVSVDDCERIARSISRPINRV
jgi:hypothetical protein